MDFDEYDYLEKTVENPEPLQKAKETANGSDEVVKSSGEKDRSRSSKHKNDAKDNEGEHRPKRSKIDELRDHNRRRESGSSRHRSQSRDGERERHKTKFPSAPLCKGLQCCIWGQFRIGGCFCLCSSIVFVQLMILYLHVSFVLIVYEVNICEVSKLSSYGVYKDAENFKLPLDKGIFILGNRRYARAIYRWSYWHLGQAQELRRHKEKKDEATEPEADPERDQRTVFAYQICLKADERDVYEFFSRAGKVRDVRLIMDRNSRRSKGVGYIEFYDAMSVPMAIALSGQPLLGQPVMVKPSEAEKNLVQSTTAVAAGTSGLIGPYSGGARRLYVGNLHSNIKEEDLRQVFGAFGPVELVQLPLDEAGQCKGFGFVQFSRLEDARNALSLNGQLEIGGRTIKVSAVTDQAGMQDLGVNTGDFDDDDGGGLVRNIYLLFISIMSLNARSRALLMQKLDRSGTSSSIAGSLGTPVSSTGLALSTAPILGAAPVISPLVAPLAPVPPVFAGLGGAGLQVPTASVPSIDTIGVPSECLLLKNMFDPALETEPNFDLDIKEDVQDECSKFGNLKHIYVDRNSVGFVYLRFENTQASMAAQRALHGRWFAGKMITATYMDVLQSSLSLTAIPITHKRMLSIQYKLSTKKGSESQKEIKAMDEALEDVVIVGAGIAGLTTCLGLHRCSLAYIYIYIYIVTYICNMFMDVVRNIYKSIICRQGIRSLVLESSESLRITGFALLTWTNAWKALDAVGIADSLRQQHELLRGNVTSSTISGLQTSKMSFLAKGKHGEHEVRCLKRKLLLEALANELPGGSIRFSSKVVSIEESGFFKLVHLADGNIIKTKVLIGSDGVNSVIAKWLGFKKPVFTGRSAFRGCANFNSKHDFDPMLMQFFGQEKELEDKPEKMRQYLMSKLGNIPEQVKAVIENTELDAFLSSPLRYRHPWELLWGNISKGNVCVAGDALHPMTPDIGQGGCSALEDGAVLARCLGEALLEIKQKSVIDAKEGYKKIEMGLKKYAKERRWRSFDLIATAYVVGFIQEGNGKIISFLRDKFFAPILAGWLLKRADFDCGKIL
ncbi:hypothetical protein FEM48_Zijuj09G0166500 [Ziziphus jujuba var. spinosa]|uniref:RRM domain-containing protein n=1 Tax=Ziziphus jujuba var. spinosa TaxID=714518 RepID=A0A978UU39_ZIZJJ|nr:hypothetical protein FEM48_Zijuj09G0166500 [Ziziphus jujuba var. spinosa]